MKQIIMGLLSGILFLTACGQSTPAPQATPQPDQPTTTSSPLPTDTPTRTALPTATLTASITPLPTIPTFTPTFDVSTIVTVTPAPKAECPKENPDLVPNLKLDKTNACLKVAIANQTNPSDCANVDMDNDVLQYLNDGGDINKIITQLKNNGQEENSTFAYKDLTNDTIADFVYRDTNSRYDGYHIYFCNNGKYRTESILHGDPYAYLSNILMVKDLNANNVLEIAIKIANALIAYEWDGNSFIEILGIRGEYGNHYQIIDINNDGSMEIILSGISQPYWEPHDVMWRQYSAIYSWNGSTYDLSMKVFEDPTYRFQTIQDADFASKQNEFDRALNLFEEAILNKNLKSLSPEIKINLQEVWASQLQGQPIPTPISEDFSEYPRLAAYAYYRIMLIHIVQNHESDAATVYNTLQEKFSNDPNGRPYVEMGIAFWNAYQSTHKMYDGCAAAIEYATEHPEILTPLGSDYHGWQSHIYKPEDVCPFR